MSSEEDFSLVTDVPQQLETTLEGVNAQITKYKKKHEQLVQEQTELAASRDDLRDLAQQFRRRTEKLTQSLKEDEKSYKRQIENEKARLNSLMQEETELLKEIEEVEAALKEEETQQFYLKQQADMFTSVPERKVYFNGSTGPADGTPKFEMEPRIVYPMEGGTALVTFEEDVVAKKILEIKKHQVDLGGECSITVEARPVQLMLPRAVEIDTEVCPQRILVSNLPKMDTETLLNKLEIHFSKRRNQGGEVEDCEMISDSWTVVVTFVEKNVAEGLIVTKYHDVMLQEKKHTVRVTPFLNGNITNLKTEMSVCPRTLLLTGIPAVMERETLQDMLEIHFQKSSNGGGEIEAFLYNPLGQHTSALFVELSENSLQNGEE